MSDGTDTLTAEPGLSLGDLMAARALDEGVEPDDLDTAVRRLRTQRLAIRMVEEADAARLPSGLSVGATLANALADGVPPVRYTVRQLHASGSNTLLGAQYKAGKTTLCLNLARSLVDDVPFLDAFEVDAPLGRVGIFNYEMSPAQFLAWASRLRIKNQDAIVAEHLRGRGFSLLTPRGRDEAVRWLERWEVQFWIIDTFRRAFTGESSNDNDEVERFLEALDIVKERAGVPDLLISAHFGRMQHAEGEERVRGATALDDWPDGRWILVKGKPSEVRPARFLRAEGRDIEMEEKQLTFDEETSHLSIGGGSRASTQRHESLLTVVAAVDAEPGVGKNKLALAVGGHKEDRARKIDEAVRAGMVEVRPAPRRGQAHHLTPSGERFLKTGLLDG